MKKHLSTLLLFIVFFIGLSLLLYPTFSDWWNSFHQSRAIVDYDSAMADLDPEDYSAYFQAAEEYNRQVAQLNYPLMYYDQVEGYEEALNLTGNGIMGYIQIPKIDVSLPIYHGTSEGVLQVAVGHLEGSSLPTGGEGTHCALSAHRGLPSARLFTDLDLMEVGDTFTLTVLDRLLTYQVDQILIVEPQDVEALYVVEGEDLCTLITCTPYGINSHRILVRGHRIENAPEERVFRVTAEAIQIDPIIVAPMVAAPMLLILLIVLLFPHPGKKRRKEG
ncbi:MAG: class C sortase [Oscillospiraceae bacterium]|nr:class C sortase [Oscillospiraceae bacterium]